MTGKRPVREPEAVRVVEHVHDAAGSHGGEEPDADGDSHGGTRLDLDRVGCHSNAGPEVRLPVAQAVGATVEHRPPPTELDRATVDSVPGRQ